MQKVLYALFLPFKVLSGTAAVVRVQFAVFCRHETCINYYAPYSITWYCDYALKIQKIRIKTENLKNICSREVGSSLIQFSCRQKTANSIKAIAAVS